MISRVLGIETSCDETAASVIEDGRLMLSNVVASQVELHAQFGGVFPEVASREHIRVIYAVVERALHDAHLNLSEIDGVAVTRGPGLPGSLVVGMNMAKGLVMSNDIPLVGVNHLEGHIYSSWIVPPGINQQPATPEFPLMVLLVSGGHTELILMTDHLEYERLGGTLDDAAGEAFDKVARLLGLSYPGGPSIQEAAENGQNNAFQFPRAWLEGSWDFSFSGLKTAVLRVVKRLTNDIGLPGHQNQEMTNRGLPVADLAASFQQSVVDVLVGKTLKAADDFKARQILVAGGVSANTVLRTTFFEKSHLPVHIPPLLLCTDNAAMIAAAGYFRFSNGQRDTLEMDVLPAWRLS